MSDYIVDACFFKLYLPALALSAVIPVFPDVFCLYYPPTHIYCQFRYWLWMILCFTHACDSQEHMVKKHYKAPLTIFVFSSQSIALCEKLKDI